MNQIDSEMLPPLDIRGAFVRKTNLSRANLRDANLAGADASGAVFRGSDFANANLQDTRLIGADLTDAKNLTVAQLRSAIIDETTKLPDYISRTALLGS